MAKVEIGRLRNQPRQYGLHKQYLAGDRPMIIRRKVGAPTDVVHGSSRKLMRQRELLAEASQHYARLTPSQKATSRRQIAEVDYIRDGRKSDTKLLMGRQLFISRDMQSLKHQGKVVDLPLELCIMLTDINLYPLVGELWLRYLENGQWHNCSKEELAYGSWLFSKVPRGKEAYRVYGEALGYFDPQSPETQHMSEKELKAHRYHRLQFETLPYWRMWTPVGHYVAYSFKANRNATLVDIHSELSFPYYTGELIIGIKEHIGTWPPAEWLASKSYQVPSVKPLPTPYHTILPGLTIVKDTYYWIEHRLPDYEPPGWTGEVTWWLVP